MVASTFTERMGPKQGLSFFRNWNTLYSGGDKTMVFLYLIGMCFGIMLACRVIKLIYTLIDAGFTKVEIRLKNDK